MRGVRRTTTAVTIRWSCIWALGLYVLLVELSLDVSFHCLRGFVLLGGDGNLNDNDRATTPEEEDQRCHRLASFDAVFVDVGEGRRPFVVFVLKIK